MILYQFPTSPFARRVRLALAHKGLTAEFRDARAVPEHREVVNRLNPMHTVPVLVDGERVICQTTAILRYLDVRKPEPALFPPGEASVLAFETIANVDSVIGILVDLGLRCAPVHGAPGYAAIRTELGGRAQRTIDVLAKAMEGSTTWLAAEFAVMSFVVWFEGLPARVPHFPPAQAMLDLGLSLPASLLGWADQHRTRPEVQGL